MLAAYSEWSDLITIWNIDGSIVKEIRRSGDHSIARALAFVADNTEIASRPALNSSWDLAVSVFDITTGAVVHELPVPKPGQPHAFASALASSPDQSLLAVAYGGGIAQPVSLYATKDWTKIADIPGPGPADPHDKAQALAFSRDGKLLAIGLYEDVLVYNLKERRLVQRIKAYSFEDDGCCVSGVAFNSDASEIAVSTSSSPITVKFPGGLKRIVPKTPIRIFRLANAAAIASYPSPLWPLLAMDWSPEGRFIAFIANDVLYLWNPASPTQRRTVDLHMDSVSLAFAPNGRWLATCSGNRVTIFDVNR
jgi:WD40 repeat protein